MRRWLPELAFDRPVSVLMLFLALLVIGAVAWMRVPLQMMPSGFEANYINIWIPFRNATPAETDDKIVTPLTAQLGTVSGVKWMRSRAGDSSASMGILFHSSKNMDEAYNEVVDRVERALPDMPEEVDRYYVRKFSPDDQPIMYVGVSLPDDMVDPYFVLSRIVTPRLERVQGVAAVDAYGVPQRSVYIDYDRERILEHGINVGDLQRRLGADNFQMAAGQVTDRGLNRNVRSLARINDVETLQRYPVQGKIVLGDIAEVQMRGAYSASVNRINGDDAALVILRKESSANTVEVGRDVEAALAELNEDPRVEGARFFTFFSQGEMVEASLDTLLETALVGGVFASIILFVFLREWRMTLLIAMSIPFSLLITIGVIYFRGGSLNLLSLMGLMLAVGMVVDNAIVVVETIYRKRADGASVREAAVAGTAEVNLAILMSTATTMVVFLPLILMSEDAGFAFFMGSLGLPVVFALAASLVVALVFAPLATRYIGNAQVKEDPRWLRWLTGHYERLLAWTLRHPFDGFAAIVGLVLLTVALPLQSVSCTSGDDGGGNQFEIFFSVPPQAGVGERFDIVGELEEVLEEHREELGIRVFYAELDSDRSRGEIQVFLMPNKPTPLIGWLIDTPIPRAEVMERVEELLPKGRPGVDVSVGYRANETGRSSGNQIAFTVSGEEMATLETLGDEIVRRMSGMPGVLGARRDVLNNGTEELQLRLDREALAKYGVSGQTVGSTVAFYLRANQFEPILEGEREVDVITRFELDDRDDLASVLDAPIWSPATQRLVPLRALANVENARGPSRIRRFNNRTAIEVTVDLEEGITPQDGYASLGAATADMEFPRGYGWEQGERMRGQDADMSAMLSSLAMSVIFVFLLMGVLFESWVLPVSIITTVPMAVMGAFWTLWIMGSQFDTMAGIGLVILVGVVVNNGIVLVDLVTQLRADGVERSEALVQAGVRRFRPILMTALTTIFGLVPMAFGSSSFAGIAYGPLGQTVIGGMMAATLLTLVFVPLLYASIDGLRQRFYDLLRYARGRATTEVNA